MNTSSPPQPALTIDLEALHRDPHYRRFRAALRRILTHACVQARLEAAYGESIDSDGEPKGGEPTDESQAA